MIAIILILLVITFLLGRIVILLSQIEEKQNLLKLEQEKRLNSIERNLTGGIGSLIELEEKNSSDTHDMKCDIQQMGNDISKIEIHLTHPRPSR